MPLLRRSVETEGVPPSPVVPGMKPSSLRRATSHHVIVSGVSIAKP